jgi:excisionase family DNA binding protein
MSTVSGEKEGHAMSDSPTISVADAGRLLGVSRGTAYQLVREQRFPVPVLRVGYQLRVPRAPLMRLLGIEAEQVPS